MNIPKYQVRSLVGITALEAATKETSPLHPDLLVRLALTPPDRGHGIVDRRIARLRHVDILQRIEPGVPTVVTRSRVDGCWPGDSEIISSALPEGFFAEVVHPGSPPPVSSDYPAKYMRDSHQSKPEDFAVPGRIFLVYDTRRARWKPVAFSELISDTHGWVTPADSVVGGSAAIQLRDLGYVYIPIHPPGKKE